MEIATQKGFERVDLHTWAGNLRAKEKRTLRSALFINPLNEMQIEQIQSLLDVLL